ncbi:MAG: hypothetical protein ACREC0_06545 [Methylocella sp.]
MDDITAVCGLGPEALSRVVKALKARPLTIKSVELQQTIAAEIGEEPAEIMERFVLGVANAPRRSTGTISNVLDGIQQSLPSTPGVDTLQLEKWNNSRPFIEQIFALKSVELSAKAHGLSYDFDQLFITSRIVTDIRPVFDDSKSEILGTTIVQTLRIEHTSSDGARNSISIAMDIGDIKQLEKVCKEALRKADVSKQLVENKCGVESMMAGDNSE